MRKRKMTLMSLMTLSEPVPVGSRILDVALEGEEVDDEELPMLVTTKKIDGHGA